MKHLLIVPALALGVGGCVTETGATFFDQVMAITAAICEFVPTVTTIAAALEVGETAAEVANELCAALVPGPAPAVNGVPVEGFVVEAP